MNFETMSRRYRVVERMEFQNPFIAIVVALVSAKFVAASAVMAGYSGSLIAIASLCGYCQVWFWLYESNKAMKVCYSLRSLILATWPDDGVMPDRIPGDTPVEEIIKMARMIDLLLDPEFVTPCKVNVNMLDDLASQIQAWCALKGFEPIRFRHVITEGTVNHALDR